MRRVILYTATQKLVMSHGSTIPMCHMQVPLTRAINSEDVFSAKEVDVDHLPIQRFCWDYGEQDQGEIFFAFDRQLQSVIDAQIRDANISVINDYEYLISLVKEELKTLQSLSLWGTVVLKFKQFWRSKT
jgi:hypothetical protein